MTLTQQVNAALAELSADIKDNKLNLLTPPDLLLEVRAFAANRNCSVEDFSNLVKRDPNISGRLVKVANSVLLGTRIHVASVKAAISRLGSTRVQNLVTSLVITQNFQKSKIHGLENYFNQAWQQSNNVAAISYALAITNTKLDPEQALLAGMVHNIGVLPIILRLNQISSLKQDTKLLIHVAGIVVPKLYPTAGKLILNNWNFSPTICQVAITHTNYSPSSDEITLDDIVFLAYELNKLSDLTDISTFPDSLLCSHAFQKIWPEEDTLVQNISELIDKIDEIKSGISN